MAKKTIRKKTPARPKADDRPIQRQPAEHLFADELAQLARHDTDRPRPAGWKLSPHAVLQFVLGDAENGIQPKFVGSARLVERCIVALATNRGLMLVGEPGTAKSYLSELLSSAISGDSQTVIQGSAATTDDQIRYSWNYALLVAEGPSDRSLVPAPLYRGMAEGKIVRFEEITRCPLEIQDTLLGILSDRVMSLPEMPSDNALLFARAGFNVIATANTRDRGVNDMSVALKRRFNFETIQPIADKQAELELVQRETDRLLQDAGVQTTLPTDLTEVLVTTFRELRSGRTESGRGLESLSTSLSTAEAVTAGLATGLHAYYFTDQLAGPSQLVQHLVSSVLKDSSDDRDKLRRYLETEAKTRGQAAGPHQQTWKIFYEARHELES